MPLLLVVARDDSFLPPGWVSAVLPGNAEPTAYERSGRLFRVIPVPDGPVFRKRAAGQAPLLAARALLYEGGEVKEIVSPAELIANRIRSQRSALKTLMGPEGLDRSHSTIWDYGPGRTYSTPQAAFDALVAQVGADPFNEVHYIRGFAGTYGQGPSGCVLFLTTVNPSARFPLVIDAQDNEQARFDGETGGCCLMGSGVSHVRVRDLKFDRAYLGIAPSGGVTVARDWLVQRCEFGGPDSQMHIGVSVFKADDLRVLHCEFSNLNSHGVGGVAGYEDTDPTRAEISGCRIQSATQGIWNNGNVSYVLVNNTIVADNYGFTHSSPNPMILAGMINNVFAANDLGFICVYARQLQQEDLRVLHSDGNCFHPGSGGMVASLPGAGLDLEAWRAWFGGDQNSIEADPLLDDDLAPQAGSPCLSAGVCWDDAGASGKRRAASVDIGCDQLSDSGVPFITVRRKPEIVRK
jgi:hypothetical protein